jgi:cyclic pyranopterin phosphate synthase
VSCATNLSLIQKEQIEALKGARVKFNIQFPYVSASDFAISTGSSKFAIVIDNIQLIKQCGLSIGLNSVVQNSNTESIRQLINFALLNQLPLKLLPQLGNEDSVKFKEAIYPILTQLATKIVDKKTGAIKFYITDGIHETTVLYIDSPCFTKSFPECKTFGEIRIHPDLEMQTCIFKPSCGKLDISGSSSSIIKQLEAAWNNFVKC